jgi:hypothetical protein
MRRHLRPLLAALAATLLLSTATGSSSARSLSVSSSNFRITWASLEFSEEFGGSFMRCPVTLEGSYHARTIAKAIGTLVGYITRGTVASTACTGGHMTILSETLPWHVTYEGFTGTLPNITRIKQLVRGFAFRMETFIGTCLISPEPFTGENLNWELYGSTAGGVFTVTTLVPRTESIACRNAREEVLRILNYRGSGNVTVLGGTARISVTLI